MHTYVYIHVCIYLYVNAYIYIYISLYMQQYVDLCASPQLFYLSNVCVWLWRLFILVQKKSQNIVRAITSNSSAFGDRNLAWYRSKSAWARKSRSREMTTGEVANEMVLQLWQEITDLQGNVFALQQFANANDRMLLKSQIEDMFDTKIKTAMAMAARPEFDSEKSY